MLRATFTLRNSPDLWLITKKKSDKISRKEVSDTYCEKMETNAIWSCDIENLKVIENEQEIIRLFEVIPDERKLFV